MSSHLTDADETGPTCDLCGSPACPDAEQPGFSEPRDCALAPIYEALRYDRCGYGCGRDVTKETIRRDIAPTLAARLTAVEAERDRLARWKAEALPVLDGLQEIGKALGLPLGAQITGPQALEAIEALQDERDRLAAAVERVEALCENWRRISAAWSSLDVLTADEKADVEALGYRDGVRTAARDLRAVLADAGRGK